MQYQLPPTADTYIHRAGRTARAGAEGVCVSVVVPQESERFSRLHEALGQEAPQQFPVDSKVLRQLRERTQLAKRIDELQRVTSKDIADFRWMKQQSAAIGECLPGTLRCVHARSSVCFGVTCMRPGGSTMHALLGRGRTLSACVAVQRSTWMRARPLQTSVGGAQTDAEARQILRVQSAYEGSLPLCWQSH